MKLRLKKQILVGVTLVFFLAAGASGWALNRFVVDHVEIADVAAYEAQVAQETSSPEASPSATTTASKEAAETTAPIAATTSSKSAVTTSVKAVVSTNTYKGSNATITIEKVVTGSGNSTVTYYVADIVLSSATSLRSAFAQNKFGTNIIEIPSTIAKANDAIFAINGDYYGFRDTGIVIRNGVIFRDKGARNGLAFYKDGTVKVYDETKTSADKLVADGVWNTMSFGPAIVVNGSIPAGIESFEVDTNFGNHSIQGYQPRTGVGVISNNHLIFIAVDGRSPGYSQGVTMTQFSEIFKSYGAKTAYNLDGGGSTTMYFNGELVNNPLGRMKERGTSDIFYIENLS